MSLFTRTTARVTARRAAAAAMALVALSPLTGCSFDGEDELDEAGHFRTWLETNPLPAGSLVEVSSSHNSWSGGRSMRVVLSIEGADDWDDPQVYQDAQAAVTAACAYPRQDPQTHFNVYLDRFGPHEFESSRRHEDGMDSVPIQCTSEAATTAGRLELIRTVARMPHLTSTEQMWHGDSELTPNWFRVDRIDHLDEVLTTVAHAWAAAVPEGQRPWARFSVGNSFTLIYGDLQAATDAQLAAAAATGQATYAALPKGYGAALDVPSFKLVVPAPEEWPGDTVYCGREGTPPCPTMEVAIMHKESVADDSRDEQVARVIAAVAAAVDGSTEPVAGKPHVGFGGPSANAVDSMDILRQSAEDHPNADPCCTW